MDLSAVRRCNTSTDVYSEIITLDVTCGVLPRGKQQKSRSLVCCSTLVSTFFAIFHMYIYITNNSCIKAPFHFKIQTFIKQWALFECNMIPFSSSCLRDQIRFLLKKIQTQSQLMLSRLQNHNIWSVILWSSLN